MTSMLQLWLPILVAAVAVFIASSILHMALPAWHRSDYPRLPNEQAVLDSLRPHAIAPGDYMFPMCDSMEEMRSPEFAAKRAAGPVGMMTIMPSGPVGMGGALAKWFVYLVIVIWFSAHVASRALGPGAPGEHVFHQIALVTFAGLALALWQMHIWYSRALLTTVKATIDSVIYAAITGGIFAWLWP